MTSPDRSPEPADLDAVRSELRSSAASAHRKLKELEAELIEANFRLRAAGVEPEREPFMRKSRSPDDGRRSRRMDDPAR